MNLLNTKAAQMGVLALVGAVVAYVVVKRLGEAADKSLDDFNAGTPYADASNATGAVGSAVVALGNATNQASGGILADFGSWLGIKAHEIFGGMPDPTGATPPYQPRKVALRAAQ